MYFPDLSPYVYFRPLDPLILNIGWLENGHPCPTGSVPQYVLPMLIYLVHFPTHQTRGWHACTLCPRPVDTPVMFRTMRRALALGDAEIRVKGLNGRTYAAPDLIVHYVAVHGYRPPDEFIEALARY